MYWNQNTKSWCTANIESDTYCSRWIFSPDKKVQDKSKTRYHSRVQGSSNECSSFPFLTIHGFVKSSSKISSKHPGEKKGKKWWWKNLVFYKLVCVIQAKTCSKIWSILWYTRAYPMKTNKKTTADTRLPLLAGDNIPNMATTEKYLPSKQWFIYITYISHHL